MIRAAMEKQDKVALGRLVMHQRERICALEPRDGGILLTTLAHARRDPLGRRSVLDHDLPKPDPGMLEIAEKIIEQQEGRVRSEPVQGPLRRRAARPDRAQEEGRSRCAAPRTRDKRDKVVDLMDALRNSLKGGGGRRPRAKRAKTARKRAA